MSDPRRPVPEVTEPAGPTAANLAPPRREYDPKDPLAVAYVPHERRWSGAADGPVPKSDVGLPLLGEIVPERWPGIVAGLGQGARNRLLSADGGLRTAAEMGDLLDLLDALPPAPDLLARGVVERGGVSLPMGARAPERRRTRQINVRVRASDYREIDAAADLLGVTATALARMLMLGGSRKILAEHRVVYSALVED